MPHMDYMMGVVAGPESASAGGYEARANRLLAEIDSLVAALQDFMMEQNVYNDPESVDAITQIRDLIRSVLERWMSPGYGKKVRRAKEVAPRRR